MIDPDQTGARRAAAIIAGATAFAAAIGLLCLWQFQASPFARVLMSDEESYTRWALAMLAGRWLPDGPLYQDPLYPTLLAAWFFIAGAAPLGVRVAQALLGAAAVALTGLAGWRAVGPRGGATAAIALALCGSLYYFELQLSKETLVIALAAGSLWLGARAAEKNTPGRWFALGLGFGLLCLCRGNFLLVAPLVALWALARGADRRRAAVAAAVFSLGVLLPVAPLAARNSIAAGDFVLTTYSGGHNLYLGNNPDADGGYVIPLFATGDPLRDPDDFRAEAQRRAGQNLSDTAAARFWTAESLRWLRQNPGAAARLYARKLFLLIHQRELPNLYSLGLLRAHFVSLLWLPFLGFGLLWGPALVGAWALRRRPAAQYAIVLSAGYAASLLPFFIVDRYRAPLLPALAVLAAGGLDWALWEWSGPRRRQVIAAALLAAVMIAAGNWPLSTPDALQASEAALAGDAFRRAGNPAAALTWFNRAQGLAPDDERIWHGWALSVTALGPADLDLLRREAGTTDPASLFQVAKRLEQLGDQTAAAQGFQKVLTLDPRNLRACLHLVNIYLKDGDRPAAAEWAWRATGISPLDPEAWDAVDRSQPEVSVAPAPPPSGRGWRRRRR